MKIIQAIFVTVAVSFGLLTLFAGIRVFLGSDPGYIVEVTYAVTADTCGLTVTFGEKTFGDLTAFADHAIVNFRAHPFGDVDALVADVEQLDTCPLFTSDAAADMQFVECSCLRTIHQKK